MVSFPKEETPADTIRYEIVMLRFCYERLEREQNKWTDKRDFRVCVECFLLHYRNLSEFFGNEQGLKIADLKKWAPKARDADISWLSTRKFVEDWRGKISQRLSHMGSTRHQRERTWNLRKMYDLISPYVSRLENLLPPSTTLSSSKLRTSPEVTSTSSVQTGTVQIIGQEEQTIEWTEVLPKKDESNEE